MKTTASWAARAANGLAAERNGRPGQLRDLRGRCVAEPLRGVEPGADRRAADRELVQAGERRLDPLHIGVELGDVAAELLAEGERHGVLQVGAADLHDVVELLRALLEGIAEGSDLREEPLHDDLRGRDVHRRGEGVVRGLRHVHVVVRVDRRLRAELPARHLDRAVRDDLVRVHVGLRAGARLPDVQREVVVERAVGDLTRGVGDQAAELGVELSVLDVGERGGLLQDPHGPHDLHGHAIGVGPADREMVDRPLRLRTPVAVARDLDRAQRVGLGAVLRHRRWPSGCGRRHRSHAGAPPTPSRSVVRASGAGPANPG